MSHNKFDQFNDLVTRLAAADGTVAEEHSHEILDTELAREVLETIVGGVREEDHSTFVPTRFLERHILCSDRPSNPYDSFCGRDYDTNPR